MSTRIHITPSMFTSQEKILVEAGDLSARGFRFPSGVCGLKLCSPNGELVLLPFQGQQVWSATFLGRQLTFRSMFEQPYPTQNFLATFGGFMQHCGATAMGSPGPEDDHPLHGELPNAAYQHAFIQVEQDPQGPAIGLGGTYEYAFAFGSHYLAQPLLMLPAAGSQFQAGITITNTGGSRMPLMYLFHINYRPVDGARLVYSAPCDSAHIRVRTSIPSHVQAKPGFREFIDLLLEQPQKHLVLEPGLAFDPEVVFFIDYLVDEEGWAYAMQVHPDGTADLVQHKPAQLPHGIRWICRTPDQDALGFEAGTAGVDGRRAEESKGSLRWLEPGERFDAQWQAGVCKPDEAVLLEKKISKMLASPP